MAQTTRRREGSARVLLLLLLALVAAGAWNYQRNRAAEKQEFRPYRGYSDAQVHQLLDAHRGDLKALEAQYQQAKAQRVTGTSGQLVGERAQAFENAREHADEVRDLSEKIAEHQAAVQGLETELYYRKRDRNWLQVLFRRIVKI